MEYFNRMNESNDTSQIVFVLAMGAQPFSKTVLGFNDKQEDGVMDECYDVDDIYIYIYISTSGSIFVYCFIGE